VPQKIKDASSQLILDLSGQQHGLIGVVKLMARHGI
jgi:hypothetical protein